MTPTQRAAMVMALDALVEINKLSVGEKAICLPAEIDTAMAAIRAALAEPQEPVAARHIGWDYLDNGALVATYAVQVPEKIAPQLYTAPQPAKQPLTDAEIEAAVASVSVYRGEYTHAIARAIEAAHGIGETK